MSCEVQIRSKDKYPGIFLPQMEAITFINLRIFYATRAVFSWEIFAHVTHLDQTNRARANYLMDYNARYVRHFESSKLSSLTGEEVD